MGYRQLNVPIKLPLSPKVAAIYALSQTSVKNIMPTIPLAAPNREAEKVAQKTGPE